MSNRLATFGISSILGFALYGTGRFIWRFPGPAAIIGIFLLIVSAFVANSVEAWVAGLSGMLFLFLMVFGIGFLFSGSIAPALFLFVIAYYQHALLLAPFNPGYPRSSWECVEDYGYRYDENAHACYNGNKKVGEGYDDWGYHGHGVPEAPVVVAPVQTTASDDPVLAATIAKDHRFMVEGLLSIGAIVGGILGFGLLVRWLFRQSRQWRKRRIEKRRAQAYRIALQYDRGER